jgi:hypothetical protein
MMTEPTAPISTLDEAGTASEVEIIQGVSGEPVHELPVDLPENGAVAPQPGWLDRMRGLLTGRLSEAVLAERLREADAAIARNPEAAINYVTRGELLLRAGLPEAALADFQQGYLLAHEEFQDADWGVVAQVTQDRALRGLHQSERQLS